MIPLCFVLVATSTIQPANDAVVSFSDDVSCQSEQGMYAMPSKQQERDLLEKLSPEGIRLYHSLDGRGKIRAIELLHQGEVPVSAVETAAKEMACRQKGEFPFTKDYQEQLEEQARLKPYTRRFGY